MNINATAASRVVWIMDNNRAEQSSENESGALRLIIDSIMENIGKAALCGHNHLEITWTRSDNNEQLTQEVEDYLIYKMGYNIEEWFPDGPNDSIVIKQ